MKRASSAISTGVKRRNTSTLSYADRVRINQNAAVASSLARSRGWVPGVSRTSTAWVRNLPLSIETKYIDSSVNTGALSANTVALVNFSGPLSGTSLNLIAIGNSGETRVGQKVNIQTIRFRGQVDLASNIIGAARVRITLILDSQANGAAPATATIFTDSNIDAFQDIDNVGRFKIIKDKFITINSHYGIPGTSTGAAVVPFKFNHKCKGTPIHYSGSAGTIAEIRSNNYFLVVNTNVGGVVTLQGKSRVAYKDV